MLVTSAALLTRYFDCKFSLIYQAPKLMLIIVLITSIVSTRSAGRSSVLPPHGHYLLGLELFFVPSNMVD